MMLMRPLALARRGLGVISGIRATAGFRYIIMNSSTMAIMITMPATLFRWKNRGIKGKATAETRVPVRIKGIRLPMGVLVRSERLPKMGRRIRAARLSQAMMIPTIHCTSRILSGSPLFSSAEDRPYILRAKISVRKVGHQESYTCQSSRIPKKAKPMSMVRLTFSFRPPADLGVPGIKHPPHPYRQIRCFFEGITNPRREQVRLRGPKFPLFRLMFFSFLPG